MPCLVAGWVLAPLCCLVSWSSPGLSVPTFNRATAGYRTATACLATLGDLTGSSHNTPTLHETFHAPLAPGGLLTIQNFAGNVTVAGSSEDGQVHVTAHQRLWAWQSSELQANQARDRPVLEPDGSGLRLSVKGAGQDQTDLVVNLPRNAGLLVAAETGEVSVSELRGSVTIAEHQGNVALTALTGPIDIHIQDDDADITGHSLSGAVQVNGRAGDLSFSDITGSLQLHGDFFGTTRLERIQAPVHFQSSFTDLSCTAILGNLQIKGRSDLEANDLTGPVLLSTTDRSLQLQNVRGAVNISNRNGPVHLTLAGPLAPVSLTTTDAAIELQLPLGAAFHVFGETSNGHVTTNLGLPIETRGDRTTITGQVHSGGPQIKLQTTQANLTVRSGEAKADAGADGDQDQNHDQDHDQDN